MFDDSPNGKPNGSMLFGPQFLATKLYQLSPSEVCWHTKNAYKILLNSLGNKYDTYIFFKCL